MEANLDYRTDSFVRRFSSAKPYLKAHDIQGVASLKYRQNVHDSVYHHFIDDLKRNSILKIQHVDGEFGGQSWLVTDDAQNRAILVEHETGLEILRCDRFSCVPDRSASDDKFGLGQAQTQARASLRPL
jgi:hypothetical protein